jgi:hypothetical protein
LTRLEGAEGEEQIREQEVVVMMNGRGKRRFMEEN